MSAKWGIFGKSFNDFVEASNKRKIAIDDLFTINGLPLKDAKKQAGSFWSYLYPSKESIQSQLIDIDTLYPDINNTQASEILKRLQNEQVRVNANKKTWQDYFNGLKEGEKWQIEFVQNTDLQKASLDDVKKGYENARQSALAHNEALKQQTLGAKAATVAMKTLSVVGNMLVFTAIAKSVQLLSDIIDEAIITNEEYLEQQDEIISKAEETISSTESRIDSLEQLREKLEETNGSQAKMLALSEDINNVLGGSKSKILDNTDALAVLNAQIEREIKLEKEKQALANKDKRDASFNKVKKAYVTDETFLDEDLTFNELFKSKMEVASVKEGTSKSVGQYYDELVKDFIESGETLNSEKSAELLSKAIEKHNNFEYRGSKGGYAQTIQIDKKSIVSSFDSTLKELHTAFEDVINNSEGFFTNTDKQNILDELYFQAGGNVDDEWAQKVRELISSLDSSSKDVKNAFEEYNHALTDDIEGNEDIIFNKLVGEFDKLKEEYPSIANVLNSYFTDIVASLQDGSKVVDEGVKSYDLFSKVFNAEDFEESAKALKELAISGELSPETLSSTKEYIQLLEDTGLSADDAVERIREFALGEASLSDIMSTIQSTSSLINDVESDINEHGEIAFDNLQKIADQFPSLEQNIRDYLNGVEGAEDELVNKLKDCYKQDLKNYDEYYEAKQGNDDVWWSNFLTNSSDLVNKLKDNYDIDLANFSTYLLAKEKMQALIDENESKVDDWSVGIGSIMPDPLSVGGYYQGKADELKVYLEEIQKTFKDSVGTSDLDALEDYTSGDKYDSGSDKDSTFDWIDTQISNMEDSLSDLDKQVSDTYSKWDTRNEKLAESITKTNEAIKLQENAAKAYMDEANSLGLSSHYKTLVQKGALNIEDISDKDLADKISEYQDLYEKSVQCTEKADELRQTLNELSSSEDWDLFKSESDADIDVLDKQIDSYQIALDKLDLNGKFANESYYNNMIDLTQSKINSLMSQEKELQSILNNMAQGTEAYDTMFSELMDIRNQIAELENDCVEFNNNIRDLDWEIFEYLEDSISRITEEVDFLKDLLSDEDMFDDNGNMTKYADATMGLHFANIETYKKKAQDYYEEMQELQQQLVNGAGQDVLEQYREMEDLHRDMVLAIQDEQKAVLDLVQNGYEEQLKILQEINQATLDRMDAERDLYNFQKDIEEKTQEKTSIERQIDVLRGDNSEEAKSKLQQLEVKLSDVNADIEETLYEQQRNDTQAMLDALESDYEEWMNSRLDDENALLEEIRGEVETKSNDIITTLKEVAGEYGTTLSTSLTDIFGSEKPFDSVVTAIEKLVDRITGLVGVDGSGSGNSSNGSSGSNGSTSTNTTPTTSTTTTSSTNTQQTSNTQSKSATDGIFIYQKSVYPKSKLDKEKSVVDRLKYFDFASDFSSRATYYKKLGGSGTYTGSSSQNKWLISKMKENGFAKGGTIGSLIRQSGEDGFVLARTGEEIFSLEKIKALDGVFQRIEPFIANPNLIKLPEFPTKNTSTSASIEVGSVQVVLPNVTNYDEFKNKLIHDNGFEKAVQEFTIGQALGRNSMNKYKY